MGPPVYHVCVNRTRDSLKWKPYLQVTSTSLSRLPAMNVIFAGVLLSMLLALGACTDNDLTSRTRYGTFPKEPASLDLHSESARL